jgi:hypothetical protein
MQNSAYPVKTSSHGFYPGKPHLLSGQQVLIEWNHLSLWSTISDGLVHPRARFLDHFSYCHYRTLVQSGKRSGNPDTAPAVVNPATQTQPIKPSRVEKITLAALTAALKRISRQSANQLRDVIRIFQPATVLRWHREVVRRKGTYPHKNKGGHPAISKELEKIILRLAQENPRWGYGKIQGELIKLSFKVSQSTVRNVLDRHGIQPAVVRKGSAGWRHLMSHYKEEILACDFFTIQTVWFQTIYVLFFI